MLILPATPEVVAGFIAAAEAAPEELSTIAQCDARAPYAVPARGAARPADCHGLRWLTPGRSTQESVPLRRSAASPHRSPIWSGRCAIPRCSRPRRATPIRPRSAARCSSIGSIALAQNPFSSASGHRTPRCALRSSACSAERWPGWGWRRPGSRTGGLASCATWPRSIPVRMTRAVRMGWLKEFAAALDQGDSGAYVNFLGDEGEARVRAAYPGPRGTGSQR